VVTETGRLDVVVHNAGHMVLGPSEATASAYDELYPDLMEQVAERLGEIAPQDHCSDHVRERRPPERL